MTTDAHPFADFIRTLGRGPSRSRALSLEEAEAAMAMICNGQAEPVQVGALLVLLRYRGETPAELAGLVRALRATVARPDPESPPDLDWPTYAAGRSRGLPWFVLSALLLAGRGVRVLMHGPDGARNLPGSAERALAALGLPAAATTTEAVAQLARGGFAYLPLPRFCPKLQELIDLRRLLGLRTAANTVARMLNPLAAPHLIQGVFHPPYRDLQQQAALLLGQPRLAVFKGGGGEAERPAAKSIEVFGVDGTAPTVESWPPLLALHAEEGRRGAGAVPDPAVMAALWRGDDQDEQATAVVIGSAALALRLLGRAASPAEADALAAGWWRERERGRF